MLNVNLTDYFRHAMELETTIHCQEQILDKLQKVAVPEVPQPKMQHVNKPEEPYIKSEVDIAYEIARPEKPDMSSFYVALVISVLGSFGFMFLFRLIFNFIGVWNISVNVCLIIASILAVLLSVAAFSTLSTQLKAYHEKIKNRDEEIERRTKAEEKKKAEYRKRCDETNQKNKEYEERYFQELELCKAKKEEIAQYINGVHEETNRLTHPLTELKQTLSHLYDKNIIYPKYRNMVAVCTIFEYLESGRCTELEGPNGAYNLYESELRQNIIISKLNEVISNLQAIQRNQYTLYTKLSDIHSTVKQIEQGVQNINSTTKAMAKNISKIKDTTDTIARNSHKTAIASMITAQYAQITAKNTEAIKYLTLIG